MFKLKFVLKILSGCIVWQEPEPPELEPHQKFYLEPEQHKNDAALQYWKKSSPQQRRKDMTLRYAT
jgi:hypothetical protein